MFTIFRMEMRFDKEIDVLFARFQKGVALIKGDPSLFRGKLYMSVKDVNPNDQKGVLDEFLAKFQKLVGANKDNNFLLDLYSGQLDINCSPPLGFDCCSSSDDTIVHAHGAIKQLFRLFLRSNTSIQGGKMSREIVTDFDASWRFWNHICAGRCEYCESSEQFGKTLRVQRVRPRRKCECRDGDHTCGQECCMANSPNCGKKCSLKRGHSDLHKCDVPIHTCGEECSAQSCSGRCVLNVEDPHTAHKCVEVRCMQKCVMTDAMKFVFTFQEMNGSRKKCTKLLPPGQKMHQGSHTCICEQRDEDSEDQTIHYCDVRCPCCSYFCKKQYGHFGSHSTSHGNMRNTYFLADAEEIDIEERKYKAESWGSPRCAIYTAPRWVENTCTTLTANKAAKRRWEDPCTSKMELELFGKCGYKCDAPDHDDKPSYCILPAWHKPELKPTSGFDGFTYVGGHKFECSHVARVIVYEAQNITTMTNARIQYRGGGTNYAAGLRSANEVLSRVNFDAYKPAIVFFSDGHPCDPLQGEQLATHIKGCYEKNGLQAFAVGFGSINLNICREAGWLVHHVLTGNELKATFFSISASLNTRAGLALAKPDHERNCVFVDKTWHRGDGEAGRCGHELHKACFDVLVRNAQQDGEPARCPSCRREIST
ncbi:von Willebrand factor, type A [Phytophthora cactorum]|nr:von Willebrand factor, type A [Phytophthora cactorum]